MKILVLKARMPYPLDFGASIRTYNLLKQMAGKHRLTLISYYDSEEDLSYKREMEKLCYKVILVERNLGKGPVAKIFRAILNLFSKYPYSVAISQKAAMREAIKKELAEEKYDLIHADTLHVCGNLFGIESVPVVLNEHNVEHLILKRKQDIQTGVVSRMYWRSQWKRLKRFEEEACRRFDRIITVSENDKKEALKLAPEAKVDIVPNGVDAERFKKIEQSEGPIDLVFTGLMNWHPNDDGMIWFLEKIFPIVLKQKPNLSLAIVGRNPSGRLKRLAESFDNVELTGFVSDVRPYMFRGKVFIVPLRVGGGTRLKIMEAMAAELPIVSTSIGCEGIEVTPDLNILTADNPDEFAKKIIRLIDNSELRDKIAAEGKKLVMARYDWSILAKSLEVSWEKGAGLSE